MERLGDLEPDNMGRQYQVAISHHKVGRVLEARGELPRARQQYEGSLAILRRLAVRDLDNTDWQSELAYALRRLGGVLLTQGDPDGAWHHLEGARQIREDVYALDQSNAMRRRDWARTFIAIAKVLSVTGRSSEALATLRHADRELDSFIEETPDDRRALEIRGRGSLLMGVVLAQIGQKGEARERWDLAVAMLEPLARESESSNTLALLAQALLRLERVDEASPLVHKLIDRGYREPGFLSLSEEKGYGDGRSDLETLAFIADVESR